MRVCLVACLILAGCTYERLRVSPPLRGEVHTDRAAGVLADGIDKANVRVLLRDRSGKAVRDYPVGIAAVPSSGITVAQASMTTNADGILWASVTSSQPVTVIVEATLDPEGRPKVLPQRPQIQFVESRELTFGIDTTAELPVGARPADVAIGDLNGDDIADIASANWGAHTLSVILGKPGGGFSAANHIGVAGAPRAIEIADMDGDGHDDLIAALPQHDKVIILYGVAAGTVGERSAGATTGAYPRALAVADIDADGFLDVVSADSNGGTVSVLLGSASGLSSAGSTFSGMTPSHLDIADLDGNETLDVVVVNASASSISLLWGDGKGQLTLATQLPLSAPVQVATADLNADDIVDIVASSSQGNIAVRLGDSGSSEFPIGGRLDIAGAGGLAIADLNNDGLPDLVVIADAPTTSKHVAAVLLGEGDGTFRARIDLPVGRVPMAIATGDLNGDSGLDFVVANYESSSVSVVLTAEIPVGSGN